MAVGIGRPARWMSTTPQHKRTIQVGGLRTVPTHQKHCTLLQVICLLKGAVSHELRWDTVLSTNRSSFQDVSEVIFEINITSPTLNLHKTKATANGRKGALHTEDRKIFVLIG